MIYSLPSSAVAKFMCTTWLVNHSNGAQGWTHMGEIQKMSEKFGLNLWPAIEQMTNRYWKNDSPFWVMIMTLDDL